MKSPKRFEQKTDEVLDYEIDYTAWLAGDTIVQSTWAIAPQLTQPTPVARTTTTTTVWLAGTIRDVPCDVTNTIITAGGRTKKQSFILTVVA